MKNVFIGLSNQKINEANIMKIETNYNVGDTVWIPKLDNESKNYIPYKRTITSIDIHIRNGSVINIIYFLDFIPMQGLYEDQLFATKYKCQLICDEKNNIGE